MRNLERIRMILRQMRTRRVHRQALEQIIAALGKPS